MNYNISPQENEYWCFPACLQAVLRRHNIEETQSVIASSLEVDSEGAKLARVSEFLKKRGFDFTFYNYNQTPFNEPDFLLAESSRRGADVLVAIPGKRLNHILLMAEFRDPELVLLDPEGCVERRRNLYELLREMHQRETGGFGVIDRLIE
jgi:ABC-type bacteriocin/lantibiotic exporter with double-glycine peptidase domain